MTTSEGNFVLLYRKVFDMDEFKKQEFSEREAWIFLICQASHKPHYSEYWKKTIDRGELICSLRYLAKRWKWSKSRVERFLKKLQDNKMIKRDTLLGHSAGHLTICNYNTYQQQRDTNRDTLLGQNTNNGLYTKNGINNPPASAGAGTPKKKSKPKPHPDHNRFIKYFTDLFQQKTGQKYVFRTGRDAKTVQSLLKQLSYDELVRRTDLFFNTEDAWLKDNWDIGILYTVINRLDKGESDYVDPYADLR